jgi:broad specificity phosphatase PhoE
LSEGASIVVHLIRHGRVASHRGDMPVTDEGQAEIRAAGVRLAGQIRPGEEIHFLCTATLRTQETAAGLRAVLAEHLGTEVGLPAPRVEWAIRNPDLFLAGRRVEMMSTPEAVAAQIPEAGLAGADVDRMAFFHTFFRSPDRIGYWLRHANPPGEDTRAVARRVLAFSASLLYVSPLQARRYVCVTHSPVMRAVLAEYLHYDPGEPEWVESIDLALVGSGTTITFRDRSLVLRP